MHTVQQMGRAGCPNGELLRLAAGHGLGLPDAVDQGPCVSAERRRPPDSGRHHDRRAHPVAGVASARPGGDRDSLERPRAAHPPRRGLRAIVRGARTLWVRQVEGAGGCRTDGMADAEPGAGAPGLFRGV